MEYLGHTHEGKKHDKRICDEEQLTLPEGSTLYKYCLRHGKLTGQAACIVALLSSYTEISPSGRGLHIIVRGHLPSGARRTSKIEMYDTDR